MNLSASFTTSLLLGGALACVVSVTLTPLARRLALHLGALDAPGERKLQVHAVPYLGGVAVMGGVALAWAALAFAWPAVGPALTGPPAVSLVVGASAMMLLGLVDDLWGLSPRVRLGIQVLVVVAVLRHAGLVESIRVGGLELTGAAPAILFALSAFWILALTNAANLMDGMDGLAASVGAVGAAVLAYLATAVYGRHDVAVVLALVAGAYGGFLFFNRHPARIFLGDAGSLPLGFVLGAGALHATAMDGVWYAAPALLVLGVPATDLLLAVLRRALSSVTIERAVDAPDGFVFRLPHRPRFFEGDRGHLHHRLLERVGSVKMTVSTLYAAALLFGMMGIWAALEPALAPMLLVGTALLGLLAVTRFLHPELRVFEQGFLLPLFQARDVGNRRLHFAWDVFVFAASFLGAAWVAARWWPSTLVELIRVALAGLTGPLVMRYLGLYRIHFRRVGVWSVWRAVSAVAAGAAVVLLVDTMLLRAPLSTATGMLFVYFTLTGSLVPRASFAFMAEAYARRPLRGRPALICGTGRAAISFLHQTRSNDGLDLRPVGFLDDAPDLAGKMIHGVPVYAMAGGEISGLLESLGAQVVVLVGGSDSDAREARLYRSVQKAGATMLRFQESVVEVVSVRTSPNTDDPERAGSHFEDRRSG